MQLKQRVIASATVYFRRFYVKYAASTLGNVRLTFAPKQQFYRV